MTKHLVLVYGSLKSGFHNHDWLGEHAEPMGDACTLDHFAMVAGPGFPFALETQHAPNAPAGFLAGELYAVDDDTLDALDRLESHPSFYRRREVTVVPDDEALPVVKAWLYVLTPYKAIAVRVKARLWNDYVAPVNNRLTWTPELAGYDASERDAAS